MYAVLKSLASRFVVYEGTLSEVDYPEWFINKIMPYVIVDEFGYDVLMGSGNPNTDNVEIYPEEDYSFEFKLTRGWDVFVENPQGDVLRLDYDMFFKHYTEIDDGIAGLNRDVVRYTIYEGYGDIIPEWMGDSIRTKAGYTAMDTFMDVMESIDDIHDVSTMPNVLVILLNNREETKYISVEQFDEHMISKDFNSSNPPTFNDYYKDIIDVPFHPIEDDETYEHLPF